MGTVPFVTSTICRCVNGDGSVCHIHALSNSIYWVAEVVRLVVHVVQAVLGRIPLLPSVDQIAVAVQLRVFRLSVECHQLPHGRQRSAKSIIFFFHKREEFSSAHFLK